MAKNTFGFASAPKVETKEAGKKKPAQVQVEMRHIKKIGALDWLITAATTVKDVFMTELKQDILDRSVTVGCEKKVKPDNFVGEEDGHTASCQLRKRTSTSVLTSEEVALCEEMGIPVEEKTITEETFIFNPAYLGDAVMMAKIEKALQGIPGLPGDIIQQQAGKKVKIVTDDSIAAAFKLDAEKCAIILPTLTTPAVSPKFDVSGGNYAPVMAEVAAIMALPELKDIIANAKKKSSRSGASDE